MLGPSKMTFGHQTGPPGLAHDDPENSKRGHSRAPVFKRKRGESGPPGLHTTARELQTCTFEGPSASNTTKIPREDPQEKEERMNIVAGEGKKEQNLGGPAEGELGEEESGEVVPRRGVGESTQILDAPTKMLNTHRTDTPQHNNTTTTHHTTQLEDPAQGGFGQGGSLAGRSMAQKTRHEQQIVPKSSPVGEGFFGVKDSSHRFGHKTA